MVELVCVFKCSITKIYQGNKAAFVKGRKENHQADRENLRCLSKASSQILGHTDDF